ncbi:MAG: hypothetical protein AAGD40_12140, partial [Pseudomonadota bacterium]
MRRRARDDGKLLRPGVKADKRPEIARILAAADPDIRVWFFYGADEAGARADADALTVTLLARIAPDDPMARVDLTPAQLKEDPARLSAEAAAMSMFGGGSVIRLDGVRDAAGDKTRDGVDAVLTAESAGNPVILTAGDLKPASALVKLVGGSSTGAALRYYQPNARDAAAIVAQLCKDAGLTPDRDVTATLADMVIINRAVAERDIET